MQIASLLQEKGRFVATVAPDRTVADAIALLTEHNVGALVVSDDGVVITGIISERDVVRSVAAHGADTFDQTVASIMSTDVWTCAPGDPVDSLMMVMTERHIRHVPVREGGALIGIVSIGDVVKSRLGELEHDRDTLVDYINAR